MRPGRQEPEEPIPEFSRGPPGPGLFCCPSGAGREDSIHFPQAPGARSARLAYAPCGAPARSRRPGRCAARSRSAPMPGWPPGGFCLLSLKRRALAPLAWLRAWRRAGAVAPAGPLRGPVPLGSGAQLAAGRVLFVFPQALGARSARSRAPARVDARRYAPCGAPARSRRPGRCAARSRSAAMPGWPPGGAGGSSRAYAARARLRDSTWASMVSASETSKGSPGALSASPGSTNIAAISPSSTSME